jgi:potassium-transporting ATPase potassium-binding subunit
MHAEIPGVILMFIVTLVVAIPLGRYIARVYGGEKTILDFLDPVERFIYRICGINPNGEMTWKESMVAMLTINLVWFVFTFIILLVQQWLPLNPDKNPNMAADQAFNTAISFLVNCDLQHYSGESAATYFTQLACMMFLMFVSAGTGLAAAAIVINSLKLRSTAQLGNFYNYFLKSCTRILLPLSILLGIFLLLNGMPMTFEGKDTITTLQGDTVQVSRGPVAAFVPIKHIGTNGGGFYGANSTHPFENPGYLTNFILMVSQCILPFAIIFALGYYLKKQKFAWMVFGVMTLGFLLLVVPTVISEMHGNNAIIKMGIDNSAGGMEGKEVRFGAAASGYWAIMTTVISTGSVNCMHDSTMPLSGMNELWGMMVNCFYGGKGVGFLNFYIFIIIAVFMSGLMVGRTPEFHGKKIEAREMKIASIVALWHPLLILAFTAVASFIFVHHQAHYAYWLNNPGYHGFSEMLYEYTSSSANNGSGFEGLGDTPSKFWNITCGLVLIFGRYLPIIGQVAIAGSLAGKKFIPESAGTLKTDTLTFGVMIFAVIVIVAALSFFPALSLGPIAEYFSMR